MNIEADPLLRILSRAKKRAHEVSLAQGVAAAKAADTAVSLDYAGRLAEKARFRPLLEDPRLDAMRFQWYFTKIENTIPIEQLRAWIDGKMNHG